MQNRRLRIAVGTGTMVAGTCAIVWKDPDTIDAGSPTTIELEYAPTFRFVQREGAYGGAGGVAANAGDLTITAVTVNGCTVTSSNAADTGGVRVTAIVRGADF